MWTRLILAVGFAALVRAQPDPGELLTRVQGKVAVSLDRLPRYMCTQTIDRVVYQPKSANSKHGCDEGPAKLSTHPASSDRLRLDVAMATNIEMYSWVGESRFDDRGLMAMVDGAISSGSFTAYLTGIFRSGGASFTYDGEVIRAGRTLTEFGFRVPADKSRYLFGNKQHQVVTGYSGTFLVDPATAELVQLEIRTNNLPPQTSACYATTTLDYARVSLKGVEFLLPSTSLLRIYNPDGSELENRATFSNCHEFLGEWTLTFDAPTDVTPPGQRDGRAAKSVSIPAGLPFGVALTAGIDTATAAAGDSIPAKLVTPIRDGFKVLVPAGAPVAARIVGIRQTYGRPPSVSLDVKLESVAVKGTPVRLVARLTTAVDARNGFRRQSVELGTLRGLADRSATFVIRNCAQPCLIGSGLESSWVTISGFFAISRGLTR